MGKVRLGYNNDIYLELNNIKLRLPFVNKICIGKIKV